MNRERALELVAALRSGSYQQCSSRLKSKDGRFCCLGVATEISDLGTWATDPKVDATGPFFVPRTSADPLDRATATLHPQVQVYFGFKDEAGTFADVPSTEECKHTGTPVLLHLANPYLDLKAIYAYSLTELNDAGWTFAQIADFIEANHEHL